MRVATSDGAGGAHFLTPLLPLGCNNGELMLGVGANTRDMSTINARLIRVEGVIHAWLVSHSITALRLALGAVFLGFGVLKYFPGVSPAAGLAEATIQQMTAGLIPGSVALVATATLECVIGVLLLVGRGLRLTVYLLGAELLGILSPVVLLPARLFAGPYHAPTLEGQYVLKDVILVAASMVIATRFRGAKITHHTTNRGTEPSADTAGGARGMGAHGLNGRGYSEVSTPATILSDVTTLGNDHRGGDTRVIGQHLEPALVSILSDHRNPLAGGKP